ncbi:hypothetical protein ACMGDM_08845 [Sphingomonas sp. DT-51]|uniref:hypothetical protein n=1 Tax=Sphingomonas sp. DT-51 TaxID=3396165 RepID=UPI003F1D5C86
MAVLGCLALLVLPLVGVTLGGLAGGPRGAAGGAAIGFVIALALCSVAGYALVRARRS